MANRPDFEMNGFPGDGLGDKSMVFSKQIAVKTSVVTALTATGEKVSLYVPPGFSVLIEAWFSTSTPNNDGNQYHVMEILKDGVGFGDSWRIQRNTNPDFKYYHWALAVVDNSNAAGGVHTYELAWTRSSTTNTLYLNARGFGGSTINLECRCLIVATLVPP